MPLKLASLNLNANFEEMIYKSSPHTTMQTRQCFVQSKKSIRNRIIANVNYKAFMSLIVRDFLMSRYAYLCSHSVLLFASFVLMSRCVDLCSHCPFVCFFDTYELDLIKS